jgi:Nuclear fragile X mental retardation-interacting protein 1 (NUFIP1)
VSQGQKRPYSTAFNRPAIPLPRPQAAPAVPSFGGEIFPPSTSQKISAPAPNKKPRRYNQLGLTPASQDHESSSDEDEEAKLATLTPSATQPDAALLKFEYGGQTATLETAADIAAYIAERKKKYPTATKVEAAKRDAEEERSKWEEAKKQKAEALRARRLEHEKIRQDELRKRALESLGSKKAKNEEAHDKDMIGKQKDQDSVTKGLSKMEKLKRKLEKAQRDARKAEQAMAQLQQSSVVIEAKGREGSETVVETASKSPSAATLATPPCEASAKQPGAADEIAKLKAELLRDAHVDDVSSNASLTSTDMDGYEDETDDATSSSGSSSTGVSGSDSDSDPDRSPDQITSKRTAPDRVLPPPRIGPLSQPTQTWEESQIAHARNPCRNMVRTGHCQFGRRCRYSHDLTSSMDGPGRVRDGGCDTRNDRRSGGVQASAGRGRGQDREGGGISKLKGDTRPARKGLYHIMVEKEVEAEQRAVVAVILEMGKKGMLDQPETGSLEGGIVLEDCQG